LVAMEMLPDGTLLTLERAFVSPLRPFAISLRRTELPTSDKTALLRVKNVAVFNSDQKRSGFQQRPGVAAGQLRGFDPSSSPALLHD